MGSWYRRMAPDHGRVVFWQPEEGGPITAEPNGGGWPELLPVSREFLDAVRPPVSTWDGERLTFDVSNGRAEYELDGWLDERTASFRLVTGELATPTPTGEEADDG